MCGSEWWVGVEVRAEVGVVVVTVFQETPPHLEPVPQTEELLEILETPPEGVRVGKLLLALPGRD
jgi:hypothetical protein